MPTDITVDDHVDVEIRNCLVADAPRSFFLFAGAGSGKTRSLVQALRAGLAQRGDELAIKGQQIAVITFTNAAADEVAARLEFSPLVRVSTIHSFAWDLVREFQSDIRTWLRTELSEKIDALGSWSSREGTKREAERLSDLERARSRVAAIDEVRRFVYSPTGENRGSAALNHSQVIRLAADLLNSKPMLRLILTTRYPILFIDESQDTNKALLEAFMAVEAEHEGMFLLGLFGDSMQRIYTDGKADIEESLPPSWAKPTKVMNHRSPARLVQLSNRIRADVDSHHQQARTDNGEGFARLFIVPIDADLTVTETSVAAQMAEVTADHGWTSSTPRADTDASPSVKRLILEHSMAARRLGFSSLFTALSRLDSERTSVLDGSVGGLQVFLSQVAPLIEAQNRGDFFRVARILRENSALLSDAALEAEPDSHDHVRGVLEAAKAAVDELAALWLKSEPPSLQDVAASVARTNLFSLASDVSAAIETRKLPGEDTEATSVWRAILEAPFEEAIHYRAYVSGKTDFDTHQGVKGLEFPRVLVVISDSEARGFTFSYEKLFGVKSASQNDEENRRVGNETSIDKTRRLFYVTTTRATSSLAVVAYTSDPVALRSHVLANGWFDESETVLL